MRTLVILTCLCVLFSAVSAQDFTPPPTIITFNSDLDAITVADAESNLTSAVLSWNTVGVTDDYRILLEAYVLDGWVSLLNQGDDPLPASGSRPITVQHPLNFGPPTYRLLIVDGQAQILEQRILIIDYADNETPAVVDAFTSTDASVDPAAITSGDARIAVAWAVSNRPQNSAIQFEQVLADGNAVQVELPRANLWIGSTGQGSVAPVSPGSGRVVRLRLRVVDMIDGTVYAEAAVNVPFTGSAAPVEGGTDSTAPTTNADAPAAVPTAATDGAVDADSITPVGVGGVGDTAPLATEEFAG